MFGACTATEAMISLQLLRPALDQHETETVRVTHGPMRHSWGLSCPAEILLLMNSGGRTVIVFSLVSTEELTRLQGPVPNHGQTDIPG